MARLLSMYQKYDIALRRVHIGIFQQEDSIYTIFLEQGKLDKKPDRTSQVLAYDQVLLTTDLPWVQSRVMDDMGSNQEPYSRLQGEPTGPYAPCPGSSPHQT